MNYRGLRARAITLTDVIIICFVAWLAIEIPKGLLTNTDELSTAERSREMRKPAISGCKADR